jgi:hypothetical protein
MVTPAVYKSNIARKSCTARIARLGGAAAHADASTSALHRRRWYHGTLSSRKVARALLCWGIASSFLFLRNVEWGGTYSTSSSMITTDSSECQGAYLSCQSLESRYPHRSRDCFQNSSLPECNQKCFDTPPSFLSSPSSSVLLTTTKTSNGEFQEIFERNNNDYIWPSLGQGQWTLDEEYCRNNHRRRPNLLYPCLMNRYRWQLSVEDDRPPPSFSLSSSTRMSDTTEQQKPQQKVRSDANMMSQPLSNPCRLLHQYNISDIHAIGDSLIRHLMQGLVIVLNGEYDYAFQNQSCVGDDAFSEYACRKEIYKQYQVCRTSPNKYITIWAIRFSYQHQHLLDIVYPGEGQGNTLYLYGVGLHASNPARAGAKYYSSEERQTILNATAYIQDKWKEMDEPYFYGPDNYLIWVPPHYKLASPRTDQTNSKSLQFLQDSAAYFQRSHARTLNTFDMTRRAAAHFQVHCTTTNSHQKEECHYLERATCQPTRETYDGSHYSRNINVIKAQMLLYQWHQMAIARQVERSSAAKR